MATMMAMFRFQTQQSPTCPARLERNVGAHVVVSCSAWSYAGCEHGIVGIPRIADVRKDIDR